MSRLALVEVGDLRLAKFFPGWSNRRPRSPAGVLTVPADPSGAVNVESHGCAHVHLDVHLVMSQRYSIAEARSRLPRIVDEAESGVEVELTRRGQPVAVLVSHREFERLRGRHSHFRDAYRKFLEKHSLKEIGVEAEFAASTRDRSRGRKVFL